MFCSRCRSVLAVLKEPASIYFLSFPIGKELWEAIRCTGCEYCWYRKMVRNTGMLKRHPRLRPGVDVGDPLLEDLSPIPQRFGTAISGKGEYTVTYHSLWWTGEKNPTFVITRDTASFPQRSYGWQEVSASRTDVVSLTTSSPVAGKYCVTLHTPQRMLSMLELVDEDHAEWIGRLFSLWSHKPFYRPNRDMYHPSAPPLFP